MTIGHTGSGTPSMAAAQFVPQTGVPSAVSPQSAHRFACRISTFHCADRLTYSETYEPARVTKFGPVGRIESRLLSGRWRHAAFAVSGEAIVHDCGHILFDNDQLPLLFDPEQERAFAMQVLCGKDSVVWLGHEAMVHGSKDGKSVGIIRFLEGA